ncbi:MAG: Threonine synthase [Acidimicrobiales bacterium]|nr:MAG: threonine synthase [Actinomycetota bacterium]MBV6508874.1 Threonine synthase [Acidimicrobiales bacterium]RIK05002.1 MAG: threonine synthase [Acidobacteriota bacterium]
MKYVSTRGAAPVLGFTDVLLTGLAADGGLYVPERWPALPGGLDPRAAYAVTATEVMRPFVEDSLPAEVLSRIVEDAYRGFDDPAVVPLRDLGGGFWLLELFHGPTLAFKDLALQLVGRLFDHELRARGERVTIVGATSGDTGSAAIEACRDRESIEIFILHPAGRVSDVQRRQMTTVASRNVHNIAVEGTFDDCQDLVKAMFGDEAFRSELRLSAVNSINWARVMAQIVYYVTAGLSLGGGTSPVAFSVPTGNFGNIFAGYAAGLMGLPISQLIVASNRNDILTRFFTTGTMEIRAVQPTISPSMDIQVSSNLERLFFEMEGRNGAAVAELMTEFRSQGTVSVPVEKLDGLRALFDCGRLDEDETRSVMADVHRETGLLIDPHTAVGLGVARRQRRDPSVPMVCLATAHPAKFPEAVEQATGSRPEWPPWLADLNEAPERFVTMPRDLAAVEAHIRRCVGG